MTTTPEREAEPISAEGLSTARRQLAATLPHQYVLSKQMLALIDEQAARIAELEAVVNDVTGYVR